jgi:hypothetical protein
LRKRGKHPPKSDADLIRRMKKILEKHGKLTHRLVGQRFRVLLMNANRVVSKKQLINCVSKGFDLSDIA